MFSGVDRVGLVVRERAVEFEVQRVDIERQGEQSGGGAQHRGNCEAAHAVAGVDDHPQGSDRAQTSTRLRRNSA